MRHDFLRRRHINRQWHGHAPRIERFNAEGAHGLSSRFAEAGARVVANTVDSIGPESIVAGARAEAVGAISVMDVEVEFARPSVEIEPSIAEAA